MILPIILLLLSSENLLNHFKITFIQFNLKYKPRKNLCQKLQELMSKVLDLTY